MIESHYATLDTKRVKHLAWLRHFYDASERSGIAVSTAVLENMICSSRRRAKPKTPTNQERG